MEPALSSSHLEHLRRPANIECANGYYSTLQLVHRLEGFRAERCGQDENPLSRALAAARVLADSLRPLAGIAKG